MSIGGRVGPLGHGIGDMALSLSDGAPLHDRKTQVMASSPARGDPYSPFKILHHRNHVDRLRRGELPPPVRADIDLTNACNQSCAYCPFRAATRRRDAIKDRDELPLALALRLLDELVSIGVRAVTLTGGGEPLAHPDALIIVKGLVQRGLGFALQTNGVLLDDATMELLAQADWVRISLDTVDPSAYATTRGAPESDLRTVKANMARLATRNLTALLGVSVLVTRQTADSLAETVAFVRDVGFHNVRIRLAGDPDTLSFYRDNHGRIEESISAVTSLGTERFAVYVLGDASALQRHYRDQMGYRICGVQHLNAAIGADGWVYPCCVWKGRHAGRLGDLREQSFQDIWCGDRRSAWLGGHPLGTRCRFECMYDTANALFRYLHEGDTAHSDYV